MLALRFYDVALSLHVAAIVVAFGVVFTYPLVLPWLRHHHPGAMVVAHETHHVPPHDDAVERRRRARARRDLPHGHEARGLRRSLYERLQAP